MQGFAYNFLNEGSCDCLLIETKRPAKLPKCGGSKRQTWATEGGGRRRQNAEFWRSRKTGRRCHARMWLLTLLGTSVLCYFPHLCCFCWQILLYIVFKLKKNVHIRTKFIENSVALTKKHPKHQKSPSFQSLSLKSHPRDEMPGRTMVLFKKENRLLCPTGVAGWVSTCDVVAVYRLGNSHCCHTKHRSFRTMYL